MKNIATKVKVAKTNIKPSALKALFTTTSEIKVNINNVPNIPNIQKPIAASTTVSAVYNQAVGP